MPRSPETSPRRRPPDHGGILPITLVLVVVFGAVAAAIASYAGSSLRSGSAVLDRAERRAAVEGAMRISLDAIRDGDATCNAVTSTILSTTINSEAVSVSCTRQPIGVGESGSVGLAITSQGVGASIAPLLVGQDNTRIAGNIYFAKAPTALAHSLFIENGDVWFGDNNCATAATPSITKLNIVTPERTYLCADNQWESVFPEPSTGALPPAAPARNTSAVPGCTVYFPGTYAAAPDLDGEGNVYFASGIYYFRSVGVIPIKSTTVIGGTPGASAVSETDEQLPWGACATAPTNSTVLARSSGTGVTWILGGDSRFTMDTKSFLELFAPASGDSLIALYKTNAAGIAKSNVAPTIPLIEQVHTNSEFSIHGRIYAPGSYLKIGNYVRNVDPEGSLILGSAVVARLELVEAPPATGYNLQVPTVAVKYKVKVVAQSTSTTLQVVAEVRRSGDQLAVNSWRIV